MASQRTPKVEVLCVVSRLLAILAVFAIVTIVFAPTVRGQISAENRRRAASVKARQNALFNSSTSSLFLPAVAYDPGGDATIFVAVADVNDDGKLDLVVANTCTDSLCNSSVGVLLGNGDGTFQPPVTDRSGGQLAMGVATADVNGDGKLDLVVAHNCGLPYCSGDLGLLLGNGDGTFQPAVSYASGTLGAAFPWQSPT